MDGSCAAHTFDFLEFRAMLARIPVAIPSVRKVWLENGRFLTATAGTLVVTVVEKKVRRDAVYLICDGGRVNHARPSAWEAHDLSIAPPREGTFRKTVVCGPTCGAIDRLGCWMLPEDVAVGDRVIWSNAGAYHLPLETRFSVGVAPVVWFDETGEPHVLRSRETPEEWWGAWT